MIYKYLPLDTNTLAGLETSTLLFSQADAFNDPFDMAFHFSSRLRREHLVAMLHRQGVDDGSLNDALVQAFPTQETEYDLEQPDRIQRALAPAVVDRVAAIATEKQQFAQSLAAQARVTCFSRSYDNTLLWSHYGGEHFGVCFGFEEVSSDHKPFFPDRCILGQDVTYGDSIDINIFDSKSEVAQNLAEALTRKLRMWEYEREYRIVLPSVDEGTPRRATVAFDRSRLKEVCFGLRTPQSEVRRVREILHERYPDPPVRLYQMAKQKTTLLRQPLDS